PGIVKIVLDCPRQIGVPRPGPRHRPAFVFAASHIFWLRLHRQRLGPVPPILIADQDGHWRPDRLRMAHPGHNLRPVRLDLHPPPAAIALLPPPQVAIDGFQGYGYAGGKSVDRGHKAFAVRLPRRLEAQHEIRVFIVTDWNNPLDSTYLR